MVHKYRVNAFRVEIGNVPAGASLWIKKLSIPKLDAQAGDARGGLTLQIPPDITQQVSAAEAQFKSVSGLTYETEVVERVREIDGLTGTRSLLTTAGTTVPGLLLLGFEPSRADARVIKSRSGHLFMLDEAAAGGRMTVSVERRTLGAWRFDRGWLFALDRTPISPDSPGNVLFVPEAMRGG